MRAGDGEVFEQRVPGRLVDRYRELGQIELMRVRASFRSTALVSPAALFLRAAFVSDTASSTTADAGTRVEVEQLKEAESQDVEDFRVEARDVAIGGASQQPIEPIAPAQRADDDRGRQRAVAVVGQALAASASTSPRSRVRVATALSAS